MELLTPGIGLFLWQIIFFGDSIRADCGARTPDETENTGLG